MDALGFIKDYSDVGASGLLVVVVILLFTGRLIPGGTHKQILKQANDEKEAWKEAHRVSELARNAQREQITGLLSAVRIADRFYRDFLPPLPEEDTIPGPAVAHVRS